MSKFLWQVSYTAQGAQGLKKDGGSARRAAVQRLVEQAGGKLEAFYFALGEADVYVIAEFWLDKPVIAINTATYWHALRKAGVTDRMDGFGKLLAEH